MRKLIWILALILASPAFAASLPQKAPAQASFFAPTCDITNCSGFYVGGNFFETGASFSSATAGGFGTSDFAMGLQAGYEFYNGQWRLGVEVGGDYGLVPVGDIPGNGNKALWSADQLVCIGYAFSSFFGASATNTTSGTPSLPQSFANALMAPCALVGAWERPWGIGLATGARASALLAKGWTLDADYIHVNYNNANINPVVSEQSENIVRMGINYHF